MTYSRRIKSLIIGAIAVLLTALGISASDEIRGIEGRLTGTAFDSGEYKPCSGGTTLITYGSHAVCMDVFEASANSACLYGNPKSELETEVNLANDKCGPITEENKVPWRYVSYTEAALLCARAGKRLPTNDEWYKVALGSTDLSSCNLKSDAPLPGNLSNCSTTLGVVNMVGNVWEWMSETVEAGQFKDRVLPESGYVSLVDESGVVITTDIKPVTDFGGDYASTKNEGVLGMLRGGFYGSGGDGGIFSQNFAAPLNLTAVGVGFRCVKDVW